MGNITTFPNNKVRKFMKYYNQHIIFWLLLLGTLGLVIFLGWGIINPPVVLAAI